MATSIILKHRSAGGPAGAPAALKTGELAYNMADGYFYVGYGDDGSGNATSIKLVAKDDFSVAFRVPAGGASGQLLARDAGGNAIWVNAPASGGTYTPGNGLTLTGSQFAIDQTIVATVSQVNNLDAGQIKTGTIALARIPALDASQISSGVFDVARIPVLPSQTVQVSSGDMTALTAAQQNAIVSGTVVTTTDGNRWVYSGSGSKTSTASYIQLADITPEWSAIANKPAIGSLAAQAANAVAITGGTLDSVTITNSTIDGGTF